MREVAERALNRAQLLGADYADVRVVHRAFETVASRDRRPNGVTREQSLGFGMRVLFRGAWGFASSCRLDLSEVDRVAALAVELARASLLALREPVSLGVPKPIVARYETPVLEDPFGVSVTEKLATLLAAEEEMHQVKGIRTTLGSIGCQREEKLFASTEGSYIEQVLTETGCGIEAIAVSESEVQIRSYPNSFGRQQTTQGYEMVRAQDLPGNAARIAQEAVQLLSAPPCPSGLTTLILDPTQLALQIHESIGHAVELDRVFGYEAAYAGTSFLSTPMAGSFLYGSPIVNVTADATLPGGLGTFGYDDEGTPASRVALIEQGVFTGLLSCRETAARMGTESNGTARADGWNRIPMVRMTNINLEPGEWSLEGMIADTEEGIYMMTNRSWSIDDKRLNFQFGCQVAWEVRDGKLDRMLKNPTYMGLTPQFWAGCDAIADRNHWQIWGTPNCGKGQPIQVAHVGHGASPARFRNVQVGVRA